VFALIQALLEAEAAAEAAAVGASSNMERARLLKLAEFLRAEAKSHVRAVA